MRRAALLAAAVALAAAAAGCRKSEPTVRIVLRDDGDLCLGTPSLDGGATELAAGAPASVVVRTHTCLTPCATERRATCATKREGDRFVITSELSWTAPFEDQERRCPGPCTFLEASCPSEPLASGAVVLAHGKKALRFDAPSRLAKSCYALGDDVAVAARSATAAPQPALPESVAAALAAPPATGAPQSPKPGDGICALPYPKGATKKGAPIGITITRPNPCVGASCSAAKPKCALERWGNRLVVKADFPAPGGKQPRQPCSDDCSALLASCRAELLPPGSYTIEHGAQRLVVHLPLGKETCSP